MVGSSVGPLVAGIDLGGTKILAGIVDAEHRILGRAKRVTPAREGAQAILAAMLDAVNEAMETAGVHPGDLAGIGVGSPGPLDAEAGVILFSPNLNVKQFALGPDLSQALGRPVMVQNDVRVGGYGEFKLGAGRGYKDLIIAFVGTGIGGCFIKDGKVVTGHTGNAGEVGHLIVKAGGPKCGCGTRGCMEALASKTAIARRVNKMIRKGIPTVLKSRIDAKTNRLKSKDLAAALMAGDVLAIEEVHRAARFLGLGLASLINVIGPELVIVGGGVTNALGNPYLELVRAAARPHTLADRGGKIAIVGGSLGDNAGILGASLLARERFAT
ncbi:MAG: ROK family protein [Isosphaeraceae bacterium]